MNAKTETVISIKPLDIQKINIRIVGDTPLIVHSWSEKAKKMMLDAQTKATKTKARDAKNPAEDFITSMYWLSDMPEEMSMDGFMEAVNNGAKFGFPVTGFKQAAISAAFRLGWTKDKMSTRGAFFIESDLIDKVNGFSCAEIHGDTPVIREDMVRVGMGAADIRYRAEIRNWYADLVISYNANGQYSLEQIINIINAGGYVCGVGEWRPEKDGQYGMFHVATT